MYSLNQINRMLGRPIPDLLILALALYIGSYVMIVALRQYAHDRRRFLIPFLGVMDSDS